MTSRFFYRYTPPADRADAFDFLNEAQLKVVVDRFLSILEKEKSALIVGDKGNLSMLLLDVIKYNNNHPWQKGNQAQNQISLGRLSVASVVALAVKKMLNENDLFKELKKELDNANIKTNDPKQSELVQATILSFLERKGLTQKDAPGVLENFFSSLVDELEKSNVLKLKPGHKKKMLDNLNHFTKKRDPYQNLLGLLDSSVTGSIPIIVYQFLGNGLGIPDVNPYNGSAPIDRLNNPYDQDSPEVNRNTEGNLLQFGGPVLQLLESLGANKNQTITQDGPRSRL